MSTQNQKKPPDVVDGYLSARSWEAAGVILELEKIRQQKPQGEDFPKVVRDGIGFCEAILSVQGLAMRGRQSTSSNATSFYAALAGSVAEHESRVHDALKVLHTIADSDPRGIDEISIAKTQDFFLAALERLNNARYRNLIG